LQISDVNRLWAIDDADAAKVYPLHKGELWVVLWHLWMPSAFDSEALQGYRSTLVEPALRDLASKKRIDPADSAAFNRFYGDLLYTEGRYEEALAAYLKADRGSQTDARAWHGLGRSHVKLRKNREATAIFQKSVNAFIRQGQYYGDVTWLLDYAEVLVMPRAANQGRNLAEGLQTTKRALSHSRCHEECLERLGVAWKSAKGSEADAARRLIRRSENGRLTLAAPYAERLQTQIPTTKSRSEANASSS
jgi:tetratricopeptide (TPR) repeat protein